MSAQSPAAYIQASSHSAALFRQALAAILGIGQPGTLGVGVGAVVNSADLAITQNGTPNMSVNVSGGVAVIPQTLAANGGVYIGLNDATVNLVISASNATNPRIDKIVATANDAAYSGGTNNWVLQVVTGTPTASATLSNLSGAAATPASSIVLGYVLVPANATTIVTGDLLDARANFIGGTIGGNPAGRATQGSGSPSSFLNGAATQVGGLVADTGSLKGGMAFASNVFTVPVSGTYDVKATIEWPGGSASFDADALACGLMHAGFIISGVQSIVGESGSSGGNLTVSFADDVVCAAGDTIGFYGIQQSGGTASNIASNGRTHISIHLVSR